MKLAAIIFLAFCSSGVAQDPQPPANVSADVQALRDLAKADPTAVDALVLYTPDVRSAVFQVCTQPDLLVTMDRIQEKASTSFRRAISCLTPAEQKMAFDIARYPGLASDLATTHAGEDSFQSIILRYPTAVHSAAMALATRRPSCDVLTAVADLQSGVHGAYLGLIADYPEETATAADLLLDYPEILSLLGEYMNQTVLIGKIYRKDPAFVTKRSGELGKEVADRNAQSLADWKAMLAENPQATGDLTEAAAAFAAEKRYDSSSRESGVLPAPPFSYWFGIPDGSSEWYTYPDYFRWGFYYDPSGSLVLVSLPSADFLRWMDPQKYSQLANTIIKHYHAHENLSGSYYAVVKERMGTMKEAPPVQPTEAAQRLADSLKLGSPTDFHKSYQAGDYWMSTTYNLIKTMGEIGGEPRH